jgi:hypothetical protein
VWATLVGVYLAMLTASDLFSSARPTSVSALLLVVNGQNLFLTGVWASLQFRWVQLSFPGMVLASERMLFACVPPVCGPILGWAVVASVGAGPAPFYLAGLLAGLYHAFSMPTPSSFRAPSAAAAAGGHGRHGSTWGMDDSLILSPAEGAMHAAALVAVPAMTYVGTHWPTMVADSAAHTAEHACSLALLVP